MYLIIGLSINFIIIFIIVFTLEKNKFRLIDGYNKLKLPDDLSYCRDIPLLSLEEAYFLGYLYGLVNNPSDLIGALILKWIKEDKISLNDDGKSVSVDMNKAVKFSNRFERKIYFKLLASSGGNYILEEKEFINFFKSDAIIKLFGSMLKHIEYKFLHNGLYKKIVFGTEYKYYLDDSLKEKAYQLAGLKKFLLDFSKINDRKGQEVALWEDYLIYAQLMGIADNVETQFEYIYPDYKKLMKISVINNTILISLLSTLKFLPLLFISGQSKK